MHLPDIQDSRRWAVPTHKIYLTNDTIYRYIFLTSNQHLDEMLHICQVGAATTTDKKVSCLAPSLFNFFQFLDLLNKIGFLVIELLILSAVSMELG